jgi:hypothetical protein
MMIITLQLITFVIIFMFLKIWLGPDVLNNHLLVTCRRLISEIFSLNQKSDVVKIVEVLEMVQGGIMIVFPEDVYVKKWRGNEVLTIESLTCVEY